MHNEYASRDIARDSWADFELLEVICSGIKLEWNNRPHSLFNSKYLPSAYDKLICTFVTFASQVGI